MSALTDLTNFDIDWLDDDLVAALTFKFDPRQPRDEEGKWTDTGVFVLKKVLPAIIYKKHPDGAVVAQRGNRRLRWDAGSKKFAAEEREGDAWVEKQKLTKTAAYAEMKKGDWHESSDASVSPVTSQVGDQTPTEPNAPEQQIPAAHREYWDKYGERYRVIQATETERGAVDAYTLNGFGTMNKIARGDPSIFTDPEIADELDQWDEIIGALDGFVRKQPPLAEDITLFRGVNGEFVPETGEWREKGFTSSSWDEKFATNWAKDEAQPTIVELRLRKGQRAWVTEPGPESEVILPLDSRFRVVSSTASDGYRRVVAELVSSETPESEAPVVEPAAETPSSSPGMPDSTLLSVSDVPALVEDAPSPSTQSRGEFDERYEGPRFEFPEGVDFDAMDRYRTEVARQYVFSDLVFERTTKLLADKERYPGFGAYSRAQEDAATELEAEGFVPADHNAIDSALTDLLASLPPTDYKLRDQVQRRAQAEAQMEGRLQAFAELHGLGPVTPKLKREFAKKIRADFAGKKIAVRVTPKNLEHILSDGRFKSQFETNKSKGLNNNQGRASAENIWFGIDDNIFVNQERRPIYGYVMVDGVRPAGYTEGTLGGTSVDALSQYGQIQVVLKDQVRERTTAVYGDSLNHASFGMPSPVNQPSWTSFTPMIGKAGIAANFSDVDRNSEDFRLRSESYVEAQIHDGVSTDDVAEVIFPSKPNAVLQKLLDERGVPWRVLTLKSAIKAGGDEGNTARHYAEQQRTYAEGKIAELTRKIDERRIAGQQPYSEQLTELKRLQKIHNDATAALSLKSATRRSVPFEQRERIYTAATLVDTYDQLPYDVRELLAQMRAELPAPYETGD